MDDSAIPVPKRLEAVEDILTDIHTRTENALLAAQSALHGAEEARRVALETRHLAEQNTARIMASEILARAAGQDGPPPPSHAKPKRDRHGMRLLPGGAAALVPAALLAGDGKLAALWGGLRVARAAFRTKRRVAAAAVLLAALGGATGGSVAANMDHAPGRALVAAGPHARARREHGQAPPAAAPVAHHRHCHDHDGDAVAVLLVDVRRCRDADGAQDTAARPAATATPPPSPVPSATVPVPTPTPPGPTPIPSVTPSALPTPSPSSSGPLMGHLSRCRAA